MCLEVYAPNQRIDIPFAHESIRFIGPQSIRSRYSLLVKNKSRHPISKLFFISPYKLLRETGQRGEVELVGPGNIVANLPESNTFFGRRDGHELTMRLPDPTYTARHLPELRGKIYNDNGQWSFPDELDEDHVLFMIASPFTAWKLDLTHPILPGDAQWFWWEIQVPKVGELLPTSVRGPRVFHRIASPNDVRRTFKEYLDTSTTINIENGDGEYARLSKEVVKIFALNRPRRVDIKYYEMRVESGPPSEQLITFWDCTGEIEMRSRSPRIADNLTYDVDVRNRLPRRTNSRMEIWFLTHQTALVEAKRQRAFYASIRSCLSSTSATGRRSTKLAPIRCRTCATVDAMHSRNCRSASTERSGCLRTQILVTFIAMVAFCHVSPRHAIIIG